MPVIEPICRRLRLLAAGQDGMALPTALFAMIASLALASVAILSSIDAQHGTTRDSSSKNAIAAADAGASVALLRLNRYQGKLSDTTPCVGPAGEAQTPTGGWCPAIATETVGGASFSYSVSAFQTGKELSVVAVGTAGGVTRRVNVGLVSLTGKNVFADEHVIGQDGIALTGNPTIETDVGTNGDISGQGSAEFCGDVRHGIGKTAPQPSCGGKISEGNKNLPPVAPPANIATVNSNCRLAANCSDPTKVDTFSKNRSSSEPWNATAKTINVGKNSALTMGGSDYLVCGLFVGPGELIMAAGAKVRIFVDTPEHCGLTAGATQVEIGANAVIVSTGYNPKEGRYEVPGIYVLGSPTIPTNISLQGGANTTNELVLYAPNSNISFQGNATWNGMVAGKSLSMGGNPRIKSDPGMIPPEISLAGLWARTHYVECTGAVASPPNASC